MKVFGFSVLNCACAQANLAEMISDTDAKTSDPMKICFKRSVVSRSPPPVVRLGH